MLFSINQKELPLVAFLLQEKMHFLSKGFPLPSGAGDFRFMILEIKFV
jgi:hypothetical protein